MKPIHLLRAPFVVYTIMAFASVTASGQEFRALVRDGGYWGFINAKGELVVAAIQKITFPYSTDGVTIIWDLVEKEPMLLDSNGKKSKLPIYFKLKNEELPVTFKLDEDWQEGFMGNMLRIQDRKTGKFGYLNTKGELAFTCEYGDASQFSDGYATARIAKKFFVLKDDGTRTGIKTRLKKSNIFSEGLALVVDSTGLWGYLNTSGEIAIAPRFKSAGKFMGGWAWARADDGKIGFIDRLGNWIIEPKFDVAHNPDPTSGMARVNINEAWCYVDKTGRMLFIELERYGDFSEGLCAGKKDALWGFFDTQGNWVIKPILESVREFHSGFCAANRNGLWGFIDTAGNWVVPPKYEAAKDMVRIAPTLK